MSERTNLRVIANIDFKENHISFGEQFLTVKDKTDFEKICLPDTFKTTDPTTNNYSIIVSGKGLVEFSFNEEI